MLKKVLALSVAAAFMLSLGSAAAFASTPEADAGETTSIETSKMTQTVRVEQPNFYLDVQPGTMTDRLTITAKVKSEDKLILRRAKTDGEWEDIGEATKVNENGSTTWQNLLRKDKDGSYFIYQVVAVNRIGKSLPAIRVNFEKSGDFRLTSESVTITTNKVTPNPDETTKPSESDNKCNQTTDPQNKDKQDNKDNKDNKATQTTQKPAATTTSRPTASTSRTTTPTSSTKVIPKTGQVGSLAPLGLLLVSGGLALLRRRQ